MQPQDFCKLVLKHRGAVRHQVRIMDHHLHDLGQVIKSEQMLADGPSISLSEALKRNSLSDDGRLLLAHTIATSVWHCYGTSLMSSRWTGDRVHFLAESMTWPHDSQQIRFSPMHPFVPLSFDTSMSHHDALESEFAPEEDIVQWAPRIFALGVVLTSILGDEHLIDQYQDSSWQEGFKDLACYCDKIPSDRNWPPLDIKNEPVRKIVREAVKTCFSGEVFNKKDLTIAERKAILYHRIVRPLEYVVKIANVQEKSAAWTIRQPKPPSSGATNTVLGAALLQSSSPGSQAWVDRIVSSQLNHDIKDFYKSNASARRTKIAILDTGYDRESLFFTSSQRRKRIKGWKDFVQASTERDIDGHGTHVLSVAMKVAPSADFYVARIAEDNDDFLHGNERVARAIDWAVNEKEVDIVSMSFGWPAEDESRESSTAIQNACTLRKDRILFFAAAGNFGGDYDEWFPAKHAFVTSVRATTHEGTFKGFNAPPDFSGADVIGTLGKDVPGASRDQEHPECSATGSSYATPIAAAIAALVLDASKIGPTSNGLVATPYPSQDKLRTRSGMRKMLFAESMSRQMVERSLYLSAMPFCNSPAHKRRIVLDYAALKA